jgi:hypothetical protein
MVIGTVQTPVVTVQMATVTVEIPTVTVERALGTVEIAILRVETAILTVEIALVTTRRWVGGISIYLLVKIHKAIWKIILNRVGHIGVLPQVHFPSIWPVVVIQSK